MADSHKHDHKDDAPGRALAAVFGSREEAKRALAALHKAHFKKTWFGTTSVAIADSGEETLTAEAQSGGGFFSQNATDLVDALVAQDVAGDTARQIEAQASPGSAIVTVRPPDDDKHDPSEAEAILARYGGRVQGRTAVGSFVGSGTSTYDQTADPYDDSLTWEEETFYRRN